MLEYTQRNLTKFVNTFSLKIDSQNSVRTNLIDPYGIKYSLTAGDITVKLPTNSEKRMFLPFEFKLFSHVMKSLEEFVSFWSPSSTSTEYQFQTTKEKYKSSGKIKIIMR